MNYDERKILECCANLVTLMAGESLSRIEGDLDRREAKWMTPARLAMLDYHKEALERLLGELSVACTRAAVPGYTAIHQSRDPA